MNGMNRTAAALSLIAATATTVWAQIPGMPLFTNPRYGSGLRIHADIGQPTSSGTSAGDLTVMQGGATLAIGPVGLGANVGARRNDIKNISNNCSNCTTETSVTGSALAQLRVAGGGRSMWSLSVFGGASMDLKAYDFAGLTQAQRDSLAAAGIYGDSTKQLTIPVGAALGLHIPLGIASLNLWGAPRWNFTKFLHCPTSGAGSSTCPSSGSGKFHWAVGADFPIFRVLSVRAAYDSGKDFMNQTVSVWGVGASIGIGGMR